ncbi:unnamed protein product [Triticum turgidum subsp. durum]|uniref:Uncharacterized protein n=1 Tax=Triticum turgidum subsp. durum TaxID=4567 RepID=A0A9R0V3T7_TRITD|nr:unnamed protein product [Triticum turgidum subsp. durum]
MVAYKENEVSLRRVQVRGFCGHYFEAGFDVIKALSNHSRFIFHSMNAFVFKYGNKGRHPSSGGKQILSLLTQRTL